MIKKIFVTIPVCLLLFSLGGNFVFSDECSECCGSACGETGCEMECFKEYTDDAAVNGCWFKSGRFIGKIRQLTANCFNCKNGDMDITYCRDYVDENSCRKNLCKIPEVCRWADTRCGTANEVLPGCMEKGCDEGFRCMPDGNCIPSTLSVEKYCTEFYNYQYDDFLLGRDCEDPVLPVGEHAICNECKSDYKLKTGISSAEGVVYGIVAGLAILMFVVNGLTLITNDDPVARRNAKLSIVYVVISLGVILLAISFVEYLWLSVI